MGHERVEGVSVSIEFDCTLKPYHDEPERGIVHDFDLRYEDYVTQWEVIAATFGREAVANNSLDHLLARIKRLDRGSIIPSTCAAP